MPSRTVRKRLDKIPAAARVAFAAAEVVEEAVRRSFDNPRGDAFVPPDEEAVAFGTLLRRDAHLLGLGLAFRGRAMLAADLALDRARLEHRRKIARRRELFDDLRGEMVEVRRQVKGFVGSEAGSRYFRHLAEETSRDPAHLCRQARAVAPALRRPRSAPRPRLRGWTCDWREVAGTLEEKAGALEQGLDEVRSAHRQVQFAMRGQRRAIAAFDKFYRGATRYLEAALDLVGLPSVADQVRPGVGRRGRPRKVERVDAYPDLVVRAFRLAGLAEPVEVPAADGEAASPEEASGGSPEDLAAARKGHPGASSSRQKIERGVRKLAGGRKKIVHGVRKPPGSRRKIVRGVRKSPGGRKKIVHGVRKSPGGRRKIEQAVCKSPEGERKIVRGRRKSDDISASASESTVGRHREGRATAGGASAGVRRAESPPRSSAPIRKLRQAASAWWERLRQAA